MSGSDLRNRCSTPELRWRGSSIADYRGSDKESNSKVYLQMALRHIRPVKFE